MNRNKLLSGMNNTISLKQTLSGQNCEFLMRDDKTSTQESSNQNQRNSLEILQNSLVFIKMMHNNISQIPPSYKISPSHPYAEFHVPVVP